jgi:quercetin dioxygenase-like cupin family protein
MMSAGAIIENPLSGERIVIGERTDAALAWELFLAPGGRVPSAHAHPEQEERFTVTEGCMVFRVRGRRRVARAGETVVVPAGAIHYFANGGTSIAHVVVETRPALRTAEMLDAAALLAQEQHARRARLPRLENLARFVTEFQHEVRAPYAPARVVRVALCAVARLKRAGRLARVA